MESRDARPADADGAGFARPPRLDALTSLRFVAAAMIATAHGANIFGPEPTAGLLYALNGGVSFFFVLSGFVLAYNYPRLDRPGAKSRFLVLRFARLWPLHFAAFLLTLALVPRAAWTLPGIDPPLAAALNLALLQAWVPIPGYAAAFNAPSWTLSVDAFLYVAFLPLLVAMRHRPLAAFVVASLASLGCAWAAQRLPPPGSAAFDAWNAFMLARFFPPSRLVEFAAGMLAAHVFAGRGGRWPRGAWATLAELAALAASAAALMQLHRFPYLAQQLGPGIADWLAQVAAAPVMAAMLALMAHGQGAIARALSTRPAVLLGDLSYATYLAHAPMLHAIGWAGLAASIGRPLAAAAYWLALLLLAWAAWRYVEGPARRAIVRAWLRREQARASLPAPAGQGRSTLPLP